MYYEQSPIEILAHMQKTNTDPEIKRLSEVALKQVEASNQQLEQALKILTPEHPAWKMVALASDFLYGTYEVD